MNRYITALTLLCILTADARLWTDRETGRQIEAEVVKVYTRREVVLKRQDRSTITVPFDRFSEKDVQHLEYLLQRRKRGRLHNVPWQTLNQTFGIELWQDDWLWDDDPTATAIRLEIPLESKTDYMENYRTYPAGELHVLTQPLYACTLYGRAEKIDSLTLVFLNQGDAPQGYSTSARHKIEAAAEALVAQLQPLLGKPKRDSLGRGDLREKVWRWDWNDHALMVSLMEGKYAALKIMPAPRADRGGRIDSLGYTQLRQRATQNVARRPNGDTIIQNIPMIDQGPKGYCSPATWERYLRYFDIPADMYLIAVAANTSPGGGTYPHLIKQAMEPLLSAYGRDLIDLERDMDIKEIAKQIDRGLPIMWSFWSTPGFQTVANHNHALRSGLEPEEPDLDLEALEFRRGGGHICMIIGYNLQQRELCISDSWGADYTERWVPMQQMFKARTTQLSILRW
tara:strand:+ start:2892 stop:4256 length:1365 start_codon:yes stop_codon:yes gene_type:complete